MGMEEERHLNCSLKELQHQGQQLGQGGTVGNALEIPEAQERCGRAQESARLF